MVSGIHQGPWKVHPEDMGGLLYKTGALRGAVTQPDHSWDLRPGARSQHPAPGSCPSIPLPLASLSTSPPLFVSLFPACLSISEDASAFISPPVKAQFGALISDELAT